MTVVLSTKVLGNPSPKADHLITTSLQKVYSRASFLNVPHAFLNFQRLRSKSK